MDALFRKKNPLWMTARRSFDPMKKNRRVSKELTRRKLIVDLTIV